MTFRMTLSGLKLDETDEPREIAARFLYATGYLAVRRGVLLTSSETYNSVPFRLFYEHILPAGEDGIEIKEVSSALSSTAPTIYRYINKLQDMDLLEPMGKRIRIRYGSLEEALRFSGLNVKIIMESYIDAAADIDSEMYEEEYSGGEGRSGYTLDPSFTLRLDALMPEDIGDKLNHILASLALLSEKGALDRGVKTISAIFRECLLKYRGRYWSTDELAGQVGVTSSTANRFVSKMTAADILEFNESGRFRLRGGGLEPALTALASYHVPTIMDRYSAAASILDSSSGE